MKKLLLFISVFGLALSSWAQNEEPKPDFGELTGNFQFDGYYYQEDSAIGAFGSNYPEEKFLGQGFMNLNYTRGNFRVGVRYENYQNVIQGFPTEYQGEGITYRYAQFVKDGLDITAGNFYEQFGSGMILRAYEERGLGFDNMFDGLRVKYEPIKGLALKGIIGRQRKFFEKSEGIVRGLDGEFNLNKLFGMGGNTQYIIGGSFVSKYEAANSPIYNLPKNVGAGAGRFQVNSGKFSFSGEYMYKVNDPSFDNGYIFRKGEGLMLSGTYSTKGFGIIAQAKRIDNLSFRSERDASFFAVPINFLPPTTAFHTYALPALYPYATQPRGEMGFQIEMTKNFRRGSFLGGKYGTTLVLNYSAASSIYKEYFDATDTLNNVKEGYKTDWFKVGNILYFQDFNFLIKKKINRNLKMNFGYYNIAYNYDVLNKGISDEDIVAKGNKPNMIYSQTFVLESQFKLSSRKYLRTELQWQLTDEDVTQEVIDEDFNMGDRVMLLLEYSVAPNWFFAVQDIYNYGHPDTKKRLHYPLASVVYQVGTTRFQVNYGRQQAGIFCVGGVCRLVPATNGASITITSNF